MFRLLLSLARQLLACVMDADGSRIQAVAPMNGDWFFMS